MKNFGPCLDNIFNLVHYLPDGVIKEFPIRVCMHPDPDGSRYATYENGVSIALTKSCFERLNSAKDGRSKPTHLPYKLRESLDLNCM